MKEPRVSIVMPTLNSGLEFLFEAMISIEKQIYRNIDVIVVDGGSTDGTLQFLEENFRTGSGFFPLQIIRSSKKGLAYDLNLGFEHAEGDFIARMDADDCMYWERIQEQVNFFLTHPYVDVLGTGTSKFGGENGIATSPKTHLDIKNEYLSNNPFFHPTIMVRRRLVDQGLFRYDPDFLAEEDYELWGRLLNAGVIFANIGKPLLAYRLHGDNAQRHPSRYRFKHLTLSRFCASRGLPDALPSVLAEFQCSSFITPDGYGLLRDYALAVQREESDLEEGGLLRLGWVHEALLKYGRYSDFIQWYWETKGWRMHGTV